MNKGLSLVELLISMSISSVLILILLSMNTLSAKNYSEVRDSWYCMQSIRNTLLILDMDLMRCACLMPQDLKIAQAEDELFIAGVPVTSSHSGLKPPQKLPPPLYSVALASNDRSILLDTIDIDADSTPDYWADLGIITDSGAFVLSHSYSRGNTLIPLTSDALTNVGDRIVPAIHYELRADGLYRNSQLIAEAISIFNSVIDGTTLTIQIQANHNGALKNASYTFSIK
jgi:prepilin-type N-terminal cleavage/methylation domain-containing protein